VCIELSALELILVSINCTEATGSLVIILFNLLRMMVKLSELLRIHVLLLIILLCEAVITMMEDDRSVEP
jgi:hypothetical protein